MSITKLFRQFVQEWNVIATQGELHMVMAILEDGTLSLIDKQTLLSNLSINVDSELSETSENPIQNKIIDAALKALQTSVGNIDESKWELITLEDDGGLLDFRLPTEAEWEAEIETWDGEYDYRDSFANVLKLPFAGYRLGYAINGQLPIQSEGSAGVYHSSTHNYYANNISIYSEGFLQKNQNYKTDSCSIRLIKDGIFTQNTYKQQKLIMGELVYYTVFNPITGRVWLDRNLGASRVATSPTDVDSYGWLYQWGRGTDGHQLRTADFTTVPSSSLSPGHGLVIANNEGTDWVDYEIETVDETRWQSLGGVNVPELDSTVFIQLFLRPKNNEKYSLLDAKEVDVVSGDENLVFTKKGTFKDLNIVVPTDINELDDEDGLLFSGNYNELTNKPNIPPPLTSQLISETLGYVPTPVNHTHNEYEPKNVNIQAHIANSDLHYIPILETTPIPVAEGLQFISANTLKKYVSYNNQGALIWVQVTPISKEPYFEWYGLFEGLYFGESSSSELIATIGDNVTINNKDFSTNYIPSTSLATFEFENTLSVNDLISNDYSNILVKYDNSSPYHIRWIGVLKPEYVDNLTQTQLDELHQLFDLWIWWSGVWNDYGVMKNNRNIIIPNIVNAQYSFINPFEEGVNNGTITFNNPTGGGGDYEYSIDNGLSWQVFPIFTDLSIGKYNLLIRDSEDIDNQKYLGQIIMTTSIEIDSIELNTVIELNTLITI